MKVTSSAESPIFQKAKAFGAPGKAIAFVIVCDVETGETHVDFYGPEGFPRAEFMRELAADFDGEVAS